VAVGRRGGGSAGITFADVGNAPLGAAPITRGSMNYSFVQDPRRLAAKDTVLFVADEILGLLSIGFGNPDSPTTIGIPSGAGAHDLVLSGNRLIVASSDGVQVADALDPTVPVLLATVPAPLAYGVALSGQTAIALLGDGGALAIDLRIPSVPLVRGIIQVPGFSRGAAWVGDTLLIAQSFGLERYLASATVGSDPALALTTDAASVRPNVRITWTIPAPAGAIGWNLYRDTGTAADGIATSPGFRVNNPLLGPTVTSFSDVTVEAATNYRYRLEAFFQDGSSRKVAEGAIHIGSNAALGRPYPNPYRPRNGQMLSIPYRALSVDAGKSIELRVYNTAGRLVRRIPGTVAPGGGFGSLTWDGRDDRGRLVSDGVYFAQLTGPGIDDARQLILLR
jgi:flagellar hook capping protein FlgD